MEVIAVKIIKGKAYTHKYSQSEWDLLGKDKNGWVETDAQKIDNTISALKASVGGANQVIDNSVKQPAKIELPVSDKSDPELKKEDFNPDNETLKHDEFMKAIAGFNKGTIKDYFDSLTPAVKYDNKASVNALQKQLGEHFKFDIVELQKTFS